MSKQFKTDDVVWAKVRGYPWWPGFIINKQIDAEDNLQYTVGFFGDSTHSVLGEDKVADFEENYTDFESKGRAHRKHVKSLVLAEEYLRNRGILLDLVKKPSKRGNPKHQKMGNLSNKESEVPVSQKLSYIEDEIGAPEVLIEEPRPSKFAAPLEITKNTDSPAGLRNQYEGQTPPAAQSVQLQPKEQFLRRKGSFNQSSKSRIKQQEPRPISKHSTPNPGAQQIKVEKPAVENETIQTIQRSSSIHKSAFVAPCKIQPGTSPKQVKCEPQVNYKQEYSIPSPAVPMLKTTENLELENITLQQSVEPALKKQTKSAMSRLQIPKAAKTSHPSQTVSPIAQQTQIPPPAPSRLQKQNSTVAVKQKEHSAGVVVRHHHNSSKQKLDKETRHIKDMLESFSGMPRKLLNYLDTATITTQNIRTFLDGGVVEILKSINDPKAEAKVELLKRLMLQKYFAPSSNPSHTNTNSGGSQARKAEVTINRQKDLQISREEESYKLSEDKEVSIEVKQTKQVVKKSLPISAFARPQPKKIAQERAIVAEQQEIADLGSSSSKLDEIRKKTIRKIKKYLDTYNIEEGRKQSNKDAARAIQQLILSKDNSLGPKYRQYTTEAIKLLANHTKVILVKELIRGDDILNFKIHRPE